MSLHARKTVASVNGFCAWASTARAGDFVVYHVGNLGRDRSENPDLHELAETVLLMQRTGWVVGSAVPLHLAGFIGTSYSATRTGAGYCPRGVLNQRISAPHWFALQAVQQRDADYSAARSIRDALSCSDEHASNLLALLFAKGWIQPADVGKGYELTPDGQRVLM